MSDPVIIVALITFLGTVVTLYNGWRVSKGKNKTDVSISHRKSLSEDEQKFRTDLLTEVDSYRDKIVSLMEKLDKLSVLNTELRIVNSELRSVNAELRDMNMALLAKVAAMQECIDTVHTSSTTTTTSTVTNPQVFVNTVAPIEDNLQTV